MMSLHTRLGQLNKKNDSLQRATHHHTHNECPVYDTEQSVSEVPVLLELWGMRSIPSLPLLPGSLWPGVVAPDKALSMG